MKIPKHGNRFKRLGGPLSKRFGVYVDDVLIGECRHVGDAGWVALLPVPGGEWVRLPGSYGTKEDARAAIREANQPE